MDKKRIIAILFFITIFLSMMFFLGDFKIFQIIGCGRNNNFQVIENVLASGTGLTWCEAVNANKIVSKMYEIGYANEWPHPCSERCFTDAPDSNIFSEGDNESYVKELLNDLIDSTCCFPETIYVTFSGLDGPCGGYNGKHKLKYAGDFVWDWNNIVDTSYGCEGARIHLYDDPRYDYDWQFRWVVYVNICDYDGVEVEWTNWYGENWKDNYNSFCETLKNNWKLVIADSSGSFSYGSSLCSNGDETVAISYS